jgi:hypothetical protein
VFEFTLERIDMRIQSVVREDPNQSPTNIALDEYEPMNGGSIRVNPAIEYVTTNGFRLIRLSELHPSSASSDNQCHFIVQPPIGEECEVSVDFDERIIGQVQSQRKTQLAERSDFWLTLAEQQLATYLWKNNRLPAGALLVVSQLSDHDLALAASWRD